MYASADRASAFNCATAGAVDAGVLAPPNTKGEHNSKCDVFGWIKSKSIFRLISKNTHKLGLGVKSDHDDASNNQHASNDIISSQLLPINKVEDEACENDASAEDC